MRLIEIPDDGIIKEYIWSSDSVVGERRVDLSYLPPVDAEPVRRGRWVDRYGGKYANPLYECSECKEKALYKYEVDVLDNGHFVQALSNACPHCRAKMDKEADR